MNDHAAPEPGGRTSAAAFARYVEPEVPVLYRVALTMAGQPADAEDLVQDTLVRAYRAIDRFDGAHPRAWLLTILRNTHRNRARTRIPALLHDDEHDTGLLDRAGDGRSAEDIVVDASSRPSSSKPSPRCPPCTAWWCSSSTSTVSPTPRPPSPWASRGAP